MISFLPAKIFTGHFGVQKIKNNLKKSKMDFKMKIEKFRRVKKECCGWRRKEIEDK